MKKGFTLIELLAVIVILAIIAVIAVPIVLNIIDETKNNATLRSADFYLDAVEYTITDAYSNHGGLTDGEYPITPEGNLCKTALACSEENTLKVEVNGETPISGTITITNGNISAIELNYKDGKTIVKNSEGKLVYQETPTAKACTRQNDEDGFDTVTCTIGENTESFYVMNSYLTDLPTDKIVMMTKYNIDPTTYRQSSSAGTVAFSSTNYWSSETTYPVDVYNKGENNLKPIVDNYVSYLNTKLTGAAGSLLTYSQAEKLGCYYYTCAGPSWVYSTNYWTSSAMNSNRIWDVDTNGGDYGHHGVYSVDGYYGARPVITISTSDIQQ